MRSRVRVARDGFAAADWDGRKPVGGHDDIHAYATGIVTVRLRRSGDFLCLDPALKIGKRVGKIKRHAAQLLATALP